MFKQFLVILMLALFSMPAFAKSHLHIHPLTNKELQCLSLNAYHEARGDGYEGMQAVIDVTLNRSESGLYPKNICAVVYQKNQFSWTSDKTLHVKDIQTYNLAKFIALEASKGQGRGSTHGALFFHSSKIKSKFDSKLTYSGKIKNHLFYRNMLTMR